MISRRLPLAAAIAYSTTDEVAPAKVLKEFADKVDKYKIRGGVLEGRTDVFVSSTKCRTNF